MALSDTTEPHRSDTEIYGEPFNYNSVDGLNLAGRRWRGRNLEDDRVPVLCLTGLSRNTKDFQAVASFLSAHGHEVIALDYRGRGESDWDPNWENYSLPVEASDIDAAVEHLDLQRFAVLGTSRGGLHAMTMAGRLGADQLAGIILNDIGPKIEASGIQRLATSIGKTMLFRDAADCAEKLAAGLRNQFPSLGPTDWLRFASQLGATSLAGFQLEYDPALANTIAAMDDGAPLPDLWPLFETLEDIPLLILRGEHSDILSKETADEMVARHPRAVLHSVEGEGHAPLLWDRATQERIGSFAASL
ncbi:alpha/beta fold hydrolase [Roseibium sp.]|uniref:alpha/beta fold hydrolase n=1 Tax=Roseibium sp. TaxID=1936156 RepID=UPI003A97F94B